MVIDVFEKFNQLISSELVIIDDKFFESMIQVFFNQSTINNQRLLMRKYIVFVEKVRNLEKNKKIKLVQLGYKEEKLLDLIVGVQDRFSLLELSPDDRFVSLYNACTSYEIKEFMKQLLTMHDYALTESEGIKFLDELRSLDKVVSLAITHTQLRDFVNNPNVNSLEEYYDKLYKLSKDSIDLISKESLENKIESHAIVSTASSDFFKKVKESFESLSSAQSFPTGYESLDRFLSGGFQKNRIYTLVGLPGSGKSTILLNLGLNVWKHVAKESDRTKFDNKKPVVYYITLENSIEETLIRFSSAITENPAIKSNIQLLQSTLDEYEDAEFILEYYKPRSISPLEILNRVRDIEADNKKVVMVVIDYISKLAYSLKESNSKYQEWERLGMISDDLKYLAVNNDLVVLTAQQFNRGARDKGRNAGHENIGGSWKIVENSDVVIYSYRNIDKEAKEYSGPVQLLELSIKKNRFGPDNINIQLSIDFDTWKINSLDPKILGDLNQSGSQTTIRTM